MMMIVPFSKPPGRTAHNAAGVGLAPSGAAVVAQRACRKWRRDHQYRENEFCIFFSRLKERMHCRPTGFSRGPARQHEFTQNPPSQGLRGRTFRPESSPDKSEAFKGTHVFRTRQCLTEAVFGFGLSCPNRISRTTLARANCPRCLSRESLARVSAMIQRISVGFFLFSCLTWTKSISM